MKYKLKGQQKVDIIEQVCETRGVRVDELQQFLNPQPWVVTSPGIYDNISEAAEIIIRCVREELKIGILVDSDVDGYCSAAMVINYLNDVMGYANIKMYIHKDKAHGLTPAIMEEVIINPPDLLIIPDAGSGDFKQHETLYNMGVEVVVIDHHEAEKYSDHAKVVNNQLNEQGNKTLSGGGMVLKLLEQMDNDLGVTKASDYYDLAAVCLVGDCMLMNVLETRYYVQQGLRNVNNPLLQVLFKPEKGISFESISYDVAPTINAFIRMGTLEERQDLLLALIGRNEEREICIRGQGSFDLELPDYILKLSSRMKSRQTTAVNKAIDSLVELHTQELPFTICVLNNDTSRNLTGLIGNKLVEIYRKPALVLKAYDEYYSGSGRTTDTFPDFKDYCESIGIKAQGHQGAFGCTVTKEKKAELLKGMRGRILQDDDQTYLVDKAYINHVSAYEIVAIDELKSYWGRGFEKPLFYVKLDNVSSNDVAIIGQKKDTIRITKNNITYIKFKCSKKEIDEIKSTSIRGIELVGNFSVNEWNNNIYPQVLIERLEINGTEVEQVNKNFSFNFGDLANIKW